VDTHAVHARSSLGRFFRGPALYLTALLLACVAGRAAAADTPAQAPVESPTEAELVVFNRTVTVFRAPFLGVSPEQRARRAAPLVHELLNRASVGVVTVQVEPQGHVLLVDGELAFALIAGDADPIRGQTLAQASAAARDALQQVIGDTRESRDMQRLLRSALVILLATLAAATALALTWKLRRWAVARLAGHVERRAAGARIAGAQLLPTDRLVAFIGHVARALSWGVLAIVAYQWLSLTMLQFPYTRPWGEGLANYLLGMAARLGTGILGSVPNLVTAVAIFLIARAVVAMSRPFFSRVAASGSVGTGWLDADTARPTQRLLTVAVWVFALVLAYPYLPGSNSEAFKGVTLLFGLVLTIGGSSVFGQAASGLVLMYSRTLRLGEYVRVNDQEGTVTEMGAFTTRLRTGLGEELTLPNSLVLASVTKNYSRVVTGRGFVLDTTVTIGYDTPWRQVEAMLLEAARRTASVLDKPAPRIFHVALSDFYPEYRLVCQAAPSQPGPRAEVLSALHANIQDVFNEYGVQIMSPHYLGDPAAPKVVPREAWHAAPARPADEAATVGDDRPRA
jgi:small-conductance mechanosensitive channel